MRRDEVSARGEGKELGGPRWDTLRSTVGAVSASRLGELCRVRGTGTGLLMQHLCT